jgi:Fibronectin type III domain
MHESPPVEVPARVVAQRVFRGGLLAVVLVASVWALVCGSAHAATAAAPGVPDTVVAFAGDGAAEVSFNAPAETGGSPITGYTVTSIPGGITQSGNSSPIVVAGLQNGTQYRFTVHAANSSGNGPESVPSNLVTPTDGSGAVINLSNTWRIVFVAALIGVFAALWFSLLVYDRIRTYRTYDKLLKQLVDQATAKGRDLSTEQLVALARAIRQPPKFATGLTRTSIALGLLTLVGLALISLLVGNSNNASDLLKTVVTGLLTALTTILGFYFGSKTASDAVAAAGGGASGSEQPVQPTVPGAPTNVTALAGDGAAEVSFEAPGSDGGAAVTGYTVTAKDEQNATAATATGTASPISVTGLTNETAYTFTVRAENSAGVGPDSDPSDAVTPGN